MYLFLLVTVNVALGINSFNAQRFRRGEYLQLVIKVHAFLPSTGQFEYLELEVEEARGRYLSAVPGSIITQAGRIVAMMRDIHARSRTVSITTRTDGTLAIVDKMHVSGLIGVEFAVTGMNYEYTIAEGTRVVGPGETRVGMSDVGGLIDAALRVEAFDGLFSEWRLETSRSGTVFKTTLVADVIAGNANGAVLRWVVSGSGEWSQRNVIVTWDQSSLGIMQPAGIGVSGFTRILDALDTPRHHSIELDIVAGISHDVAVPDVQARLREMGALLPGDELGFVDGIYFGTKGLGSTSGVLVHVPAADMGYGIVVYVPFSKPPGHGKNMNWVLVIGSYQDNVLSISYSTKPHWIRLRSIDVARQHAQRIVSLAFDMDPAMHVEHLRQSADQNKFYTFPMAWQPQ